MSAAAATVADAPAPKGKKKLLVMIIAAVVVLAIAGVGAVLLLKKKDAGAEDEADAGHAKPAVAKVRDPKSPPVFAPLDPFTVNLADREAERYAQIGITLELDAAPTADALKVFMPAVRNNILMLLAHKTSTELMERDGKEKLAKEVARETARGLGIEVKGEEEDEEATTSKKKKKPSAAPELPIVAVYFSTFIIQ
jgi:flagellar FliL protein